MLVVKLDSSTCVIVGGTFDKLVEQLACEEKPGKCFSVCTIFCVCVLSSPLVLYDNCIVC